MKALCLAFGVFAAFSSISHADERSAVRDIQNRLIKVSQDPRISHPSEARGILDQKVSQVLLVESQISNLLHVISAPNLRQALISAQNTLRRVSRTPTADQTWTVIHLGELLKLTGQAAGILNVKSSEPGNCVADVLRNPLEGEFL